MNHEEIPETETTPETPSNEELAAKNAELTAALEALEKTRTEDLAAQQEEREKHAAEKSELQEQVRLASEENEKLKTRVAELEVAQTDAEELAAKIAAEKYGAGVPAKPFATGDALDIDTLKAQLDEVKDNPAQRVKFIRSLSDEAFNAIFHK